MSGAPPSALAVRPFRVAIEAAAVEDLRRRLRSRARPAAPFAGGKAEQAWAAGTDAHALEELCAYWESGFEWRGAEAELNAWPQFKAKVDDVDLHFIHVANAAPGAIPLLLVHGWPGSVYEFHRLLPLLARDEAHPVSLVVPSLPGFGWSSIESGRGHSALSTAALLDKLMVGLGYAKYAVQGGDWGAVVVDTMAQQFPQRVCALHLNMPVAPPLPGLLSGRAWFHRAVAVRDLLAPSLALDAEDQHTVARLRDYVKTGSSYFLVHSTRPGMVGPALNDSPVALLSWILEKFHAWTDRRGGPAPGLSRDQMLANVSIYWFTQTIESSMRFYLETVPLMPWVKDPWKERSYCSVPTAVAKFPDEIIAVPKQWVRLTHNLVHWQSQAWGGHFAAFENPGAMHADITAFLFHHLDWEECKRAAAGRKRGDAPTDSQVPLKTLLASAVALWAVRRALSTARL